MIICCANFVPVKVRISYKFDLALSQRHVCLRFIPSEASWSGVKQAVSVCRSFNRRKTFAFDLVDICWDQTHGEVIVRKILKNKITCSSNLVSETSSFLVNILFASSKKNLKSGKFLVICIHCEAKTSTSFYWNRKLETKIS